MAKIDGHRDLGELLLSEGLVSDEQLQAARVTQAQQDKSIGRVLVEMGLITEQAKMAFLRTRFHFEIVDIGGMQVGPELLTRIACSYAEKHRCVPILIQDTRLVVAMEDPTDIVVIDEIKAQTGMDLIPVLAPIADIERLLETYPHLPQEKADAVVRKVRRPLWVRILRPLVFWAVVIAPLVLFMLLVMVNDRFRNEVSRTQSFDLALYIGLGWALWAIIAWEIEGLLVGHEKPGE